MYIYGFSVRIYEDKESIEEGLICGESYADAARKVEEYYGDILDSISLECIANNEVIVLPKEYESVIKLIKQNCIW